MMWDPITCHGQSWGNYCLVCEDELLEQHTNENSVTCITCKNKKDSFSVKWDYAQCETCATEEYFDDAR
jgi:hypothetical protein